MNAQTRINRVQNETWLNVPGKGGIAFLLREIFYGDHIMSLNASATALLITIFMGEQPSFLIFLSTYLFVHPIYMFDRYIGFEIDKADNGKRSKHISTYYRFIPLIMTIYTLIFIIIMFSYALILPMVYGMIIFVVGLLYGKYLKKLTRYVVGFKNIVVAFFWLLFVSYGLLFLSVPPDNMYLAISAFVFFIKMLGTQVFFDIKDRESDAKEGLKTIPVCFGKNAALFLSSFLHICAVFFLSISSYYYGRINPLIIFIVLFTTVLALILFHASRSWKIHPHYYFFLRGEYLCWLIFSLFGVTIIGQ